MKRIAVGVVFLVLCLSLFSAKAFAGYAFFDGNEWNKINTYGLSEQEAVKVKAMFLKSAYEVSLFSGAPMLAINTGVSKLPVDYNADFTAYAKILDAFYSINNNIGFPIFFALKIADMTKTGASDTEINNYKLAIVTKLTQQGLWK